MSFDLGTTNQTADQAYADALVKTRRLAAAVLEMLDSHARSQAANPRNWGFVGDMQHYAELLEQILPEPDGDADMSPAGRP